MVSSLSLGRSLLEQFTPRVFRGQLTPHAPHSRMPQVVMSPGGDGRPVPAVPRPAHLRSQGPTPPLPSHVTWPFGVGTSSLHVASLQTPSKLPTARLYGGAQAGHAALGGGIVFPKCYTPILYFLASCFLLNKVVPWPAYLSIKT